ncbi:platelet-derived growth factor subunit A [Anabrus simplex]|uniref:platelet-derived growth factor subunit A n=1 Tax=Anabrus simplex TaxID=316456 RepID=UPI0035A31017
MANLCTLLFVLWLVCFCYCASRLQREAYRGHDHHRDFYYTQEHDFDHHHHDQSNTSNVSPEISSRNAREIPLELLKQLSNVNDLDEFISNFVDQESVNNTQDVQTDLLSNRFGNDDERKSVLTPKQAACTPELKVISLRTSDDPALFYYPFCTRVERCGGCCASALLSCQPSQTEIINYQVMVTEYQSGKKMQFRQKEIIPVERHTKCKCDCIIKEKDCNQYQEYRKNECRCVCLNVDEQQKCLAENETKLWDHSNCTCECRDTKECSTGFYFDQYTCSCVPVPKVRGSSPLQERQRRGQRPQQKEVSN